MTADPFMEWETIDGMRCVRRAASAPGNRLDWKLMSRTNKPTVLLFSKKTDLAVITVTVVPTSMHPAARSIEITSLDGGPLDPKIFAALRLPEFLTVMAEQMASPFLRHLIERTGESGWLDPFIEVPKPGRKGRPDVEYAIWADRYVLAVHVTNGKPMPALESDFPGHTASSLRAILNKARRRGLLTAADPGKAGGKLTKKAIDLLEESGSPITSKGS